MCTIKVPLLVCLMLAISFDGTNLSISDLNRDGFDNGIDSDLLLGSMTNQKSVAPFSLAALSCWWKVKFEENTSAILMGYTPDEDGRVWINRTLVVEIGKIMWSYLNGSWKKS